jgi:hypothetical protein
MKAFKNKITGEWSKLDLVSEGEWGWFTSNSPFIHPDTCTIEGMVEYCEKTGSSINMENMELIVLEDYFEKQFLERYIKIFEKEKTNPNSGLIELPTDKEHNSIGFAATTLDSCISKLKRDLKKLKSNK